MLKLIDITLAVLSVLVTLQSAHTLYLTLYTWDRPPGEARAPDTFVAPRLSFTVMLPARHEEAVIQTTIERAVKANYPSDLLQVFVICSADDHGTIAKAEEKIAWLRREGLSNVSVVVFHDGPINKPHGLNAALARATDDVVTIFDAEDDIHPDIFNIVNTVMETEHVRVVQAGVQLMNFDSELVFGAERPRVLLLVQEPPALPRTVRRCSAGREHRLLRPRVAHERRRLGRAQPDRGR